MGATRTPGITIGADGRFFIDKRHRGIRIGVRVGAANQEQAEQRLRTQMQQIDSALARRPYARATFADCAARYLTQSQNMRSIEAIRIHVRLLVQQVIEHGSRRLRQVNVTAHPSAASCAHRSEVRRRTRSASE